MVRKMVTVFEWDKYKLEFLHSYSGTTDKSLGTGANQRRWHCWVYWSQNVVHSGAVFWRSLSRQPRSLLRMAFFIRCTKTHKVQKLQRHFKVQNQRSSYPGLHLSWSQTAKQKCSLLFVYIPILLPITGYTAELGLLNINSMKQVSN